MSRCAADRPSVPETPHIAFTLLDENGTLLAARQEHRPFYAASTIKLHVLIAALRAVDAGRLDLDATVPATRASTGRDGRVFTLDGDHLDPTHPADGTPIRIRDLFHRMIDRSSNEATNAVIDLIGLEAIDALLAELGLTATRIERRIGDASALADGLTNETCAADLARTMNALATGALVSSASTDLALAALRDQRIPVIATALGPGVDIGSKSGEIERIRHDVAFIGTPGSRGSRTLAILTSGLDERAADEAIRALACALVPSFAS